MSTADVIDIIHRFWLFEDFHDRSLVEIRHTKDPKYIKGASIKFGVMLNNNDKAIGSDSRINQGLLKNTITLQEVKTSSELISISS